MRTLFTNEQRKQMREELNYSKPTHSFDDAICWNHEEKYGTNTNGTKFRK